MKRPSWRTALLFTVVLSGTVLAAGPAQAATPTPAPMPSGDPAPQVAPGQATAVFTKGASWDSGYLGLFTITNGTDSRLTWRLDFDLPAGTAIDHFWATQITRDADHYSAVGLPWNAVIQPGASVVFGILANGTGAPVSWRVNKGPCAGSGCAAADIQPPTTPGDLRREVADDKWTLRWTPSSDDVGVVGYEVHLGTDDHSVLLKTVSGTEYVYELLQAPTGVHVLPPPPDYAFRIRAIDAAGNASAYAVVSWHGRFVDTEAPTAPVDLTFGGSTSGFKLSWGKATDDVVVAGYDVFVNDKLYGPTSRTSLTVPPLGFGMFTFSVVAFDGEGKRSPAVKQTIAIDPGPAPAP